METNDLDAKSRIMKAAMDILDEESEISRITVRRIAEKAEVGIGLINYHFQSKEKLLYEAVNVTMSQMAEEFRSPGKANEMEPIELLKYMLKKLSDFALKYRNLTHISVSYALLQGDMDAEMYLLPVLRELYGRSKDECELRLLAFTLVKAMQVMYLRADDFQKYSGIDILDEKQRNESIDMLIANIIKK
jgi:AcrR family transcriptional regulator